MVRKPKLIVIGVRSSTSVFKIITAPFSHLNIYSPPAGTALAALKTERESDSPGHSGTKHREKVFFIFV